MQHVLIVGAGPSGLVLALSLRKNGVPVRIIDKEPRSKLGERGAGISPRSLELHHILGTVSDILSSGKPILNVRAHDLLDKQKPPKVHPFTQAAEKQAHVPYTSHLMLAQYRHENVLRSHLEKTGTVVEYGSELKGFQQSENHVTVQIVHRSNGKESVEETQVPWLVGTDGSYSTVRNTLGLPFLGETRFPNEMVFGDVKVTTGLDHDFWDKWVGPSDTITLRPSAQDKDIFQFALAGPGVNGIEPSATGEDLVKTFYSITGRTDIVFGDFVWLSKFRPGIRMVTTLRVGRVFLAGDAAHSHSPLGGQGMNASLQDSFNLGWKLSLVYKGYASTTLLDTYQEERLPITAEMLDKTAELFNKAAEPKRGTYMSQLEATYRASSLIGEDNLCGTTLKFTGYNKASETAACPGDRAPEIPSLVNAIQAGERKHETLFGILSPSHHSVLVFAKKYDEHSAVALSNVINRLPGKTVRSILILPSESSVSDLGPVYDQVFIDSGNHAYASYGLPTSQTYNVVVRPDGVIGARVHEVAGVERYFQKIFS